MLVAVSVLAAVALILAMTFRDGCDCDVGAKKNSFDFKFDQRC